MSDFRPDNLTPDPRDRHRSARPVGTNQEPQLNLGNLDLPLESEPAGDPLNNPQQLNNTRPGGFTQGGGAASQQRSNKGYAFSRQRLVMGVAILVLLVFILLLALTMPKSNKADHNASSAGEKTVDLAGLSREPSDDAAINNQQSGAQDAVNPSLPASQHDVTSDNHSSDSQSSGGDTSHSVSQQPSLAPPAVASTPVQDNTVDNPLPGQQNKLTVQGDLNQVLVPRQAANDINHVKNNQDNNLSSGHSDASTGKTSTASSAGQQAEKPVSGSQLNKKPQPPEKARGSTRHTAPATGKLAHGGTLTLNTLKSAPASYYTIQLSSSSSDSALRQWAQKNAVKNYLVYKTTRNNQPWYVLVSGLYPSRAEAKQSLSRLPGSVQAKSPWLKPVRLAQDELKQ